MDRGEGLRYAQHLGERALQEIKNSEMTEFQPPTLTVSIHLLTHVATHTLTHTQHSQRRALDIQRPLEPVELQWRGTTLGDLKD